MTKLTYTFYLFVSSHSCPQFFRTCEYMKSCSKILLGLILTLPRNNRNSQIDCHDGTNLAICRVRVNNLFRTINSIQNLLQPNRKSNSDFLLSGIISTSHIHHTLLRFILMLDCMIVWLKKYIPKTKQWSHVLIQRCNTSLNLRWLYQ